jgi:hypothetical protein
LVCTSAGRSKALSVSASSCDERAYDTSAPTPTPFPCDVGSKYKVDASYLSPHVNLAARLEAATKQYGVPILLSHDFAKRLSRAAQSLLRLIDCVKVKGSAEPMKLYTIDIFTTPLYFGENPALNWDRAKSGVAADDFYAEAPADFPIRIDFERDPAVAVLQTITPNMTEWAFPDPAELRRAHRRAKRASQGAAAAALRASGSWRSAGSSPSQGTVHVMPMTPAMSAATAPPARLSPDAPAATVCAAAVVTPRLRASATIDADAKGGRSDSESTVSSNSSRADTGTTDATSSSSSEVDGSGAEGDDDFDEDRALRAAGEALVERFFSKFNEGVIAFIKGDWAAARRHLKEVDAIKAGDGPTQMLLRVMDGLGQGGEGGPAPVDWAGWHELTEK